VCNLVQEKRPTIGLLQQAMLNLVAINAPKKFNRRIAAGNGPDSDINEGSFPAATAVVEITRQRLFT